MYQMIHSNMMFRKEYQTFLKLKEVLGFEATTGLDEILDEVIPWVFKMVDRGDI